MVITRHFDQHELQKEGRCLQNGVIQTTGGVVDGGLQSTLLLSQQISRT